MLETCLLSVIMQATLENSLSSFFFSSFIYLFILLFFLLHTLFTILSQSSTYVLRTLFISLISIRTHLCY